MTRIDEINFNDNTSCLKAKSNPNFTKQSVHDLLRRAGYAANETESQNIELGCNVADEDLYIVFPVHVIGEMYEREELAQHVDEGGRMGKPRAYMRR